MSHEHENHRPNSDPLAAVEQTLAGFAPAPPQLDRDRLMFLAGQASVLSPAAHGRERRAGTIVQRWSAAVNRPVHGPSNSRHWLWPAATATFATTALALFVALAVRPAPQPQIVYLDRIINVPPTETTSRPPADAARSDVPRAPRIVRMSAPEVPQGNYLRTRDVALRLGLDALGISRGADGQALPALTYRELLEGLTSPAASSTRQSPDRASSM